MRPAAILTATILLHTGTIAVAQTAAPTAPTPAASDAEKKVCRRVEAPTGSIMPMKRVCLTAAGWAARNQQGRASVKRTLEDQGQQMNVLGRP